MASIKIATSVMGQLEAGKSILAAARLADIKLVKGRVAALEKAQRDYEAAHAKVQAAESNLAAGQVRLGERDVDQDAAVDALARALIVDGKSRTNPFNGLGSRPPGALMGLPVADEADEIHRLVAAVRRDKTVSKATLTAAQLADKAASAVEAGIAEIEKLQGAIRNTRHDRDAVAQTWATAIGALKRAARSAEDDGAVGLFDALFDRPAQPNGNKSKRSPKKPDVVTPAAVTPSQPAA